MYWQTSALTAAAYTELFSGKSKDCVLNMELEEVKAMVDEYEKRHRIKVGDIVEYKDDVLGVILDEDGENEDLCAMFDENGCVELVERKHLTKVANSCLVEVMMKHLSHISKHR